MRWRRQSPASGSEVDHMRFQDSPVIRRSNGGGVMEEGHLPVMAEEVLSTLVPFPGSLQIDTTVGGGGHTERILEATSPDGRLLGLDADGAAIARVAARLRRFGDRLRPPPAELPALVGGAPAPRVA